MLKDKKKLGINCAQCQYKKLCIPYNLNDEETQYFDSLITQSILLEKDEPLFNQHAEANSIYAVYEGYCKEYWVDVDGNEYIENFYFPGDVLGFESIPRRIHSFSVQALTPMKLCIIPIDSFSNFFKSENLLQGFIKTMCYKMQNDAFMRKTTAAKTRVATFLLQMALRYQERGMSHRDVYLPMSRLDISQFLGVAYETLSRILNEFKRKQLITILGEKITITDLEKLKLISNSTEIFGHI
jgi:CRP/FNR family transcriptional regulator, anaerobic regulatory protein